MATRKEIIEVIDALLEGSITPEEARQWAIQEEKVTPPCEDPCSTLLTLRMITDPIVQKTDPWQEELPRDKEVLARGVPCPQKDLGKTIEAYWMGYTPGEWVALCQIKRKKTRFIDLIEESWEKNQLNYHKKLIPILEEKNQPILAKDIHKKKKNFEIGIITREKAIQWVIHQLKRKKAANCYEILLRFYWKLQGVSTFSPEYENLSDRTSSSLLKTAKELLKTSERKRKR